MSRRMSVQDPSLPAGTMILMASGESRAIETLATGEVVRTESGTATTVIACEKRHCDGQVYGIGFGSGVVLWATPEHPVLTDGGYVEIRHLYRRDVVQVDDVRQWAEVLEVKRKLLTDDVYRLELSDGTAYWANGVLVSNCRI